MKKQVIIIVSADEWDGIPRVRHQIANYFSQNHKVIFIENPRLTFLSLFRDIKRIKRIFSRNRIKQYGNIYIYSPQLSLPFWDKIALINEFNNFLLRQQIKKIISHLKLKKIIYWYFYFNHAAMIGKSDELLSIYTAHDVWEEYSRYSKEKTIKMENAMIESVDIVFFTSQNNFENKKKSNPQSYYIPHGAPIPDNRRFERPADLPVGSKIIGYWGLIDSSSIDVRLIMAIAKKYSSDHVVLIGPSPNSFRRQLISLTNIDNIHYLGMKKRGEMSKYLQYLDIGIIPYPRSPFRLKCSPLKVYDYLSHALPVVSIDIYELEKLSDLVYISHDLDEFIVNIEHAFTEDVILREKRKEYCLNNTWNHRLEDMKTIIEKALIATDCF